MPVLSIATWWQFRETIQSRKAIMSGIRVENSRISECVGLPKGPVRIQATIFFFVDIQPTGNFQKVFHAEQLLYNRIGRRFARDNADFATRAIHKRCDNMLCSRAKHLRWQTGCISSKVQSNLILPKTIIKQNKQQKNSGARHLIFITGCDKLSWFVDK